MVGDCPYLHKEKEYNQFFCKKNFRMETIGATRLEDEEILKLYCKEYNYTGCPFYSCKKQQEGCFLTTAMCSILGKKDNCYELETLRKFRDEVLKKTDSGRKIINDYYSIAPEISLKLMNHKDKKCIAVFMNNHYIKPILSLIKHKDYNHAINMYIEMVRYIKNAIK